MALGLSAAFWLIVIATLWVLVIRRRGSPEASHSEPVDMAEVRQLLEQKGLIQAIKRYRELTGVGLKEAKDAVESLAATGSLDAPPPPSGEARMEAVQQAIREGQLIMAIKHYRDATGLGLKEAKDAVEEMRDGMRARGEIA